MKSVAGANAEPAGLDSDNRDYGTNSICCVTFALARSLEKSSAAHGIDERLIFIAFLHLRAG